MGYGIYNLKDQIDKMIDTQLIVIASHGHPDHTFGCFQFASIYISKDDIPLFWEYNSKDWRKAYMKKIEKYGMLNKNESIKFIEAKMPEVKELAIGTEFDLGNITAKVISLKGHTKGSIGLLLKEPRILLTGDAICNDLWLFLPEAENIETNIKTIENVMKLPFDYFIAAHKQTLYPKEHIKDILDNLKHLSFEKSREICLLTGYNVYESRKATPYEDSVILYTEDKI